MSCQAVRLLTILIHALHEDIGDPESREKIAGAHFFFAVVFSQVQKLEDVRMPRLQINSQAALPLAPALVDVARRIVEDSETNANKTEKTSPVPTRTTASEHESCKEMLHIECHSVLWVWGLTGA